jgi:signal transduction histidine kinase
MSAFAGLSARVRLALMSSALFLVLGTALIVVIVLVEGTASPIHISVGSHTAVTAAPSGGPLPPVITVRPNDAVIAQQHADNARLIVVAWVVLLLTALAAIPLGWFAAGRMLRPLREITARARTISAGNLHERLALSGARDEFTQLGETLDELLARLEASFDAQRRFVANASHELRTPVTVERTLLQVALADPDADAQALRSTCEEALQLSGQQARLIDALLTLATSERGVESWEPFDLGQLTEEIVHSRRRDAERHGVRIEATFDEAHAVGDASLVESLVANLLDNAIRHNVTGGAVAISSRTTAAGTRLSVGNTGAIVPSGDVERLFGPFQRLGDQRVGPTTGHGLGLAIVHAIATAHGAILTARPRPQGGLDVQVTFRAHA